ncbi:hypothetical protein D6851_03460 [Altericroceibacterium spongiae]|uniref:Type IV pilus biogenesis protein PilP n=1 Tax=Altericroceibacterium spongiae TaxID=2320269 RepID=A0A420ESC2_9SPHN|nr:hypothetical protein [Altericroceibacterium spongiae]RKF23530.1 hypothetical protein D6851_03460 [Altericroceibacterium spongiae]
MNMRFFGVLLAGSAGITAIAAPASGQMSDTEVLNILRECAKVQDPSARLSCYDSNISGSPSSSSPTAGETTLPAPPPAAASSGSQSAFGAEDIRSPERFTPPPAEKQSLTARVLSARQREPGIYLVTLENGAQWLFSESVPFSFSPPRKGSTVTIDKASLGSYLMQVGRQSAVRVKRIK